MPSAANNSNTAHTSSGLVMCVCERLVWLAIRWLAKEQHGWQGDLPVEHCLNAVGGEGIIYSGRSSETVTHQNIARIVKGFSYTI
jgi:hypothetical protein